MLRAFGDGDSPPLRDYRQRLEVDRIFPNVAPDAGFVGGIKRIVVAPGLGLVSLAVGTLEDGGSRQDVTATLGDALVRRVPIFKHLLAERGDLAVVFESHAGIVGGGLTIAGDQP